MTRIAGLSDAVAGGVFLLVMLFSAACDLAVGGVPALVAVALLGAILGGSVTKALAFLGEAELGSLGWTGRALAILTIGRVVAAPIWSRLGRRLPLVMLRAVAFGVVGLGGAMFVAAPASIVAVEAGVLIVTGSLACAVMLIFARRSLREVMSA